MLHKNVFCQKGQNVFTMYFLLVSFMYRNYTEIEMKHFDPLAIKGPFLTKMKHFSLIKVNFQISSHENVDETGTFVKILQFC